MTEDGLFPTTGTRGAAVGFPTCARRGLLRSVILAETGQDVRLCVDCASCESLTAPGMDLTLGEIVRAAARSDPQAPTCATLSACEDLLLRHIPCTAGLSLPSILIALQREAELRGLAPLARGAAPMRAPR
jgi:hypothetical protein